MDYETPRYLTFGDDELPSVRVIQAISSLIGAPQEHLSPLRSVIDPESLNGLARSNGDWTVAFEYEGFHVTVHSDGRILLRDPRSIHTTLTNAANVLLLAPRAEADAFCTDLQFPSPPDRQNVLSVAVDRSADEVADDWVAGAETSAERKIVSLGDFARSADAQSVTFPGPIEADLIPDERDLGTLLERIETVLAAWDANPHVTTLCVRSIDGLLSRTDLDSAFGFLYDLTARVRDSEAIAHYHLDPLACDDDVVTTLTPLFDAVVTEDGNRTASIGR